MDLTWLDEPSVPALRTALRTVAPDLADRSIVPRGLDRTDGPEWAAASAVLDDRFVAKFAWAETPARRVWHQVLVIRTLGEIAPDLPLPELVAVSRDPAMMITRRIEATPFFDIRDRIGAAEIDQVAEDFATVLAALHAPVMLAKVDAVVGPLPMPRAHTTTDRIRTAFPRFARPDQRDQILAWCDWTDRALAAEGRTVLVHGDFHGDNHLWDAVKLRLRLVVDLETVGAQEPEFDLRTLPSDCGIELFEAIVAHYTRISGVALDVHRIMAWHVRTVLGDALWRSEAGIHLPDHRTPVEWVDDLTARFAALGISAN